MLMYTNCLRRHNQPNLNVSIVLQKLFINKFHVKSVLKLSVKCTSLLDILKKVRFIVFRRVTCFGISPDRQPLAYLTTTDRLEVDNECSTTAGFCFHVASMTKHINMPRPQLERKCTCRSNMKLS